MQFLLQTRSYTVVAMMIFPLLLCCFGSFGCKGERDYSNIPYIRTDTTIDITSAMYNNLEFVGGWGYIPSGYKGIFIYNISGTEFIALERCCTYDPEIFEARVSYDINNLVLRDSVCGSEFRPFFAGGVVKGPAELPLRQYKTKYFETGASKRLQIYN
jgi:hypothetical protein